MNRGGGPSYGTGENFHNSETSGYFYHHPHSGPSDPRGRGRGRGRGKGRRRDGTWQPSQGNSYSTRRDGEIPLDYCAPFLSQHDAERMNSVPIHPPPPQRPFLSQPPPLHGPPPYGTQMPHGPRPTHGPRLQNPNFRPNVSYGPPHFHNAGIIDQFCPNPSVDTTRPVVKQDRCVNEQHKDGSKLSDRDKVKHYREHANQSQGTHSKHEASENKNEDTKQTSSAQSQQAIGNEVKNSTSKAKSKKKKKKGVQQASTPNLVATQSRTEPPLKNNMIEAKTHPLLTVNENAQRKKKETISVDEANRQKIQSVNDAKPSSVENAGIIVKADELLQDDRNDEAEEFDVDILDLQIRSPVSTKKELTLKKQEEAKYSHVPINFGIELLDSIVHNNIELVADQGAVIRANSVILSLNSPVIHHMTTVLELNRVEMREFREQSVRYFVESIYTGKVPAVQRDMFRDLNKISHAFKVEWLQLRCFDMFSEFSSELPDTSPDYEDLFFLFEEAAYVLARLKMRSFLAVAFDKIKSSDSTKMFIKKYLVDIESLPDCNLDMVVQLAGREVHLIVLPIKEQLLKQLGVEGAVISQKYKYLLEKCDLTPCRQNQPDLFEQLFDVLQELASVSSEDMKWVLQLHRKSANKSVVEDKVLEKPDDDQKPASASSTKSEKSSFWFWQKKSSD